MNSRCTEVDIERCVNNIGNRFDMILIATARSREIKRRHQSSERPEHLRSNITALLDIQNGETGRDYLNYYRK